MQTHGSQYILKTSIEVQKIMGPTYIGDNMFIFNTFMSGEFAEVSAISSQVIMNM